METWLPFRDARFKLLFKYPDITPEGHVVQKTESASGEVIRVHLVTLIGGEVYFEVTKYAVLPAREEHEQHRQHLEQGLGRFSITDLKTIPWKSLPAYHYSFAWNQGTRSVLLFARQDATYRILYDPRSSVNEQILFTLEWID